MSQSTIRSRFNRRLFLLKSAQFAAGLMISSPLTGFASLPGEARLSFYHTHTRETLTLNVPDPNRYNSKLIRKINYFLRDFRTGDVHQIDPQLLNILLRIQEISGHRGTYEIISGYRSPATNDKLRKASSGVAKKSLHMKGQAVDVRLRGLDTWTLREVAWSMRFGGVGYYAKSDFVHLDTGRVRTW